MQTKRTKREKKPPPPTLDANPNNPTQGGGGRPNGTTASGFHRPVASKPQRAREARRNPKAVIQADGALIEKLEREVQEARRRGNAAIGKDRKNSQNGMGRIIQLLGEREASEAAWLTAVVDCEEYAARVPITQVTGAVPVNLYRKTEFGVVTASTTYGLGFVGSAPDGWFSVNGQHGKYLHADGTPAAVANTTGITYASASFPPEATTLPTGASSIILGDVSSDFRADGDDGTEYIMIGQRLEISALKTPNGAADEHFVGRVHAFRTLDPERYPISGATVDQLRALSLEEDSSIQHVEYLITPEGEFVALNDPDEVRMATLSLFSLPVFTGAYAWQRIVPGSAPLGVNNPTFTLPSGYDIGFAFDSATGTDFEVKWTGLWQTEVYPSNRVRDSDGGADTGGGVGGPVFYTRGAKMRNHRSAYAVVRNPRSTVANPLAPIVQRVAETGPRRVTAPTRSIGWSQAPKPAPASVMKLTAHVGSRLGQPLHPAAAALATASSAMEQPGVWSQLGDAGIAALRNILCDSKSAKAVVNKGPGALEAMDADKGWSLKNIMSTVWDAAKAVGPSVLAALL